MTYQMDFERRAFEWHGWKPTGARQCPRALAGKRCQRWHRGDCICAQFTWTLLDHARRWKTTSGEPILTAEPYDIDAEQLDEFRAALAELGLTVDQLGTERSPWYPGWTTLLVIRRTLPGREALNND